jgi:hypothetical protein
MGRRHLDKRYTTPEMEELALKLGAYYVTVYGWRHRGVPLAWRIKLVTESKNQIKLTDFESPTRKRKWTR